MANELVTNGYSIFGIDLRAPFNPEIWKGFSVSSCETTDFEKLMNGNSIFAVCHLAGGASVGNSIIDPYSDFSSLLPGTSRLAVYIVQKHPSAKFLFFSSAAVYGNSYQTQITESNQLNPISPYGVHKLTAESLLVNYSKIFQLEVIILRIFSVYGEGLKKQLIWDLGQRALKAKKEGLNSIELKGTGNEKRDFIHVSDICNVVFRLINIRTPQLALYNLASGNEVSIARISELLLSKLKLNLQIKFNGLVPLGDPISLTADITKLKELDILPLVTIDNGLERTANWIRTCW
ncbi:MAG: SDR family oxidoreductase [Cytophagales bacterium]|nr:SDR family oxidoreductase [Cytophagales bacterium]